MENYAETYPYRTTRTDKRINHCQCGLHNVTVRNEMLNLIFFTRPPGRKFFYVRLICLRDMSVLLTNRRS